MNSRAELSLFLNKRSYLMNIFLCMKTSKRRILIGTSLSPFSPSWYCVCDDNLSVFIVSTKSHYIDFEFFSQLLFFHWRKFRNVFNTHFMLLMLLFFRKPRTAYKLCTDFFHKFYTSKPNLILLL